MPHAARAMQGTCKQKPFSEEWERPSCVYLDLKQRTRFWGVLASGGIRRAGIPPGSKTYVAEEAWVTDQESIPCWVHLTPSRTGGWRLEPQLSTWFLGYKIDTNSMCCDIGWATTMERPWPQPWCVWLPLFRWPKASWNKGNTHVPVPWVVPT